MIYVGRSARKEDDLLQLIAAELVAGRTACVLVPDESAERRVREAIARYTDPVQELGLRLGKLIVGRTARSA